MKIGVQKDAGDDLDVDGVAATLNRLCRIVAFESLPDRLVDQYTPEFVSFEEERERVVRLTRDRKINYTAYVTSRQYDNNYFFYLDESVAVLSLYGWQHFTPLPRENGLAFFLVRFVLQSILPIESHEQSTGCLFDFLGLKTEIDRCLKQASICSQCRRRLETELEADTRAAIIADVVAALDVISKASRWGELVTKVTEAGADAPFSWQAFEQFVADYYRALGAQVQQDVNLAGFQIDVLATEQTPSGERVRNVIECKFQREKLGNRAVNEFVRVLATIREAGLVERGTLVSYSGFTQDAQLVAEHANLKLLTYPDLHAKRVTTQPPRHDVAPVKSVSNEAAARPQLAKNTKTPLDVFVIMPFTDDLEDVYFFGIHEAIKELRLTCARVDNISFTGSIVDEIYRQLATSRLIVAEVTNPNANVFYELGIAHALQRPVVLITKDVSNAPFDVRVVNHLVYNNIRDLKQKLLERVRALLT